MEMQTRLDAFCAAYCAARQVIIADVEVRIIWIIGGFFRGSVLFR